MLFGSCVLECAVEKEVLLEILQNSQSPKKHNIYMKIQMDFKNLEKKY